MWVKRISVEHAYQWAQRIAVREWPLMLPVALAFFALPGLLIDIFLPDAMKMLMTPTRVMGEAQAHVLGALCVMLFFNMLGALAITTLALVPGVSVQEALLRAVRRVPILIGSLLIVFAALLGAVLVVALIFGALHVDAVAMQNILLLIVSGVGAVLWVRLVAVTPVLVERILPPLALLRRAWMLSKGASGRLFAALAVYFFGGTIVLVALSTALGAVATIVAQALGAGAVGLVVAAIIFRLIAAVVSTGFQLLIAGLYRQLASNGT